MISGHFAAGRKRSIIQILFFPGDPNPDQGLIAQLLNIFSWVRGDQGKKNQGALTNNLIENMLDTIDLVWSPHALDVESLYFQMIM